VSGVLHSYQDFVRGKLKLSSTSGGIEVFDDEINSKLFPFQRDMVKWALATGKAALFEECGLGKTPQQLEWARHVAASTKQGRTLVLAPLAVSQQTIREGAKFGIDVSYARDQSEVTSPITITNYERLDQFDPQAFGGAVLDESGIIKNYTGKRKAQIFAFCQAMRFKLPCSATPAPNDHMELGQHSEFLDVLTSHEMLARWFINDLSAFGTYRLKGHAARDFWDWTCSWARYVGTPADLGYSDAGYRLPGLEIKRHVVGVDILADRGAELFRTPDLSATAVHKEKRRSVVARAERVGELVLAERNEPWLIWCETDYEEAALREVLPDAAIVNGKDPLEAKEERLGAFATGGVRHLITKATIAGYGLNFQHCARMAFVGPTFSYERFYQAVRRCHRFGQKRAVHAHVVMGQTEAPVWNILTKKSDGHEAMAREMFAATRRAMSVVDDRAQPYEPRGQWDLAPWIQSMEQQR
jgi:superfamily II DNA or RNA helicase